MRKSKEFNELLLQYEATSLASGLRPNIFKKMRKKAKTFSDWTEIYHYASDEIRHEALDMMRETVLKGRTLVNVQLNIMELFLIIDDSEKDEILEKYLEKHHKKDDFLFAITQCDWEYGSLEGSLYYELEKYYDEPNTVQANVDARYERNHELLEEFSTFNPWYDGFCIWAERFLLSAFLYFIFHCVSLVKEHQLQELAIDKFPLILTFHAHYFCF